MPCDQLEMLQTLRRVSFLTMTVVLTAACVRAPTTPRPPPESTELGAATVPQADSYLSQMHLRIHPFYADRFIEGLDPPSDRSLRVTLEIVLYESGRLHHLATVRSSGNRAFDLGTRDALQRVGDFGVPPATLVSFDGRVYVHWTFFRDDMRCSNVNARLYRLNANGGLDGVSRPMR